MTNFKLFANTVNKSFDKMSKGELFVVDLELQDFGKKEVYAKDDYGRPAYDLGPIKDKYEEKDFFDFYLDAFTGKENPIFRTRTFHDGSYDKQFIRRVGGVISIDPKTFEKTTVWDNCSNLPEPYNRIAKAMRSIVKSTPIKSIFRSSEWKVSVPSNKNLDPDGNVETFYHFYASIDKAHYHESPGNPQGKVKSLYGVFKRSMNKFTIDALETVKDLIDENSLYRGQEHKKKVNDMLKAKKDFRNKIVSSQKDSFLWHVAATNPGLASFRNTSIGTLVTDLSEGKEVGSAVKSFESKVAPQNYKRPKALITQRMVDDAVKTLKELNMEHAVDRRLARASDMDVNDVLFVDRDTGKQMIGGSVINDLLSSEVKKTDFSIKNAKPIPAEDFIEHVVPQANKIEALVRNDHTANFMTVTAPKHGDSGGLFSWNNDFGWAYNGGITDSDLRREVAARGGSVNGDFRFSHSWNHEGRRNASLMDLHVFHPGNSKRAFEVGDKYGNNEQRVGWNKRQHLQTGGVQDVDYILAVPSGNVPVENITYPSRSKMSDGIYRCAIHNWKLRSPTEGGFKAEIEFDGQVFEYDYPKKLGHKEWVLVAEVTLENGVFSIAHKIPCSSQSSKNIWGVDTNNLATVRTIMNSPNYWGNNKAGNKHTFFILDGCEIDEEPRGIFNEFLSPALYKHRKVFEVLGNKTKCELDPDQLSGVGFSHTKKAEIELLVTDNKGKKTAYNVNFG